MTEELKNQMPAPGSVEARALEIASEVRARFDAHERLCDERNAYVAAALSKMERLITDGFAAQSKEVAALSTQVSGQKVSNLSMWLSIAVGVIVLLLSVVGFFTVRLVNAIH